MRFKITTSNAELADLVAAHGLLVRLDDEVGPTAMRLLADLATRPGGKPLLPADVTRAAGIVNEMTTLTRAAGRALAGIEPAAEHVADAELLATQWLERITGPSRPFARAAGRLGLLMLGQGQQYLTAALDALDEAAGRGERGKRRPGRPARDPRFIDRLLQLAAGKAPTEEHADTLNREFGTNCQVGTLRTYYWRHSRPRRQALRRAA